MEHLNTQQRKDLSATLHRFSQTIHLLILATDKFPLTEFTRDRLNEVLSSDLAAIQTGVAALILEVSPTLSAGDTMSEINAGTRDLRNP